MKANFISRSVITLLSCCTITLLGGWIGYRPSSPVSPNGPNLHHPGIADSSHWDSAGWAGRVVVGEYLTGVYCPLCQAHERAFDSLLKRYPSTAFIPLAYHMAGNWPIANPDEDLRKRVESLYGHNPDQSDAKDSWTVPPKMVKPGADGYYEWDNWINGHGTGDGDEAYYVKAMSEAIDADLRKAPEAALQAEAAPHGGTIVAKVQVTSLSSPHSDVFVRMLIVEEPVNLIADSSELRRYAAEHGGKSYEGDFRLNHRMVVHALSRDGKYAFGSPLHGTGTVSYTFDMAKLQKQRLYYWDLSLGKVKPKTSGDSANVRFFKGSGFPFKDRKDWTMDPTKLSLVALVQDAHTGDILQAQMIPVNTGLHGELLKLP